MKKTYFLTLAFILSGWLISCDENFLDKKPVGAVPEEQLSTPDGLRKALISAYSWLNADGIGIWMQSVYCEMTGSVRGGEYYKGSSAFDMNAANDWQGFKLTTGDGFAQNNFTNGYTGVDKCNIVLKACNTAVGLTEAQVTAIRAEARFLRGIYYLHLKKVFYNIPWIDETTTNFRVPNYEGDPQDGNYVDIWPQIIDDFRFAAENLPVTQSETARANSWAAQCFLAKSLLYAGTFDAANYASGLSEALDLFNDAIANGKTSNNLSYALVANYHDNFDAAYEHNSEYVFGVELSTLDGDADGMFNSPNSNQGAQFWGLWRDPTGPDRAMGWGFEQPTEWWANHFRTDVRGLPYLDMFVGASSSTDTLADDYGLAPAPAAFTIDPQPVDPRLDWSIGRRGVDYLGWGDFPGSSWIRSLEGGPYENKKHHVWRDQVGTFQSTTNCYPAINQALMRFADVLLMAAELEVRVNHDYTAARDLVNQVRNRMVQNSTSGRNWVKVGGRAGTVNAANYVIGLYDAGNADDPFINDASALKAILYERTLELGGEGFRHYDVVRFGKALEEFNTFYAFTKSLKTPLGGLRYGHMTSAYVFDANKDEFAPIPTVAIDRSVDAGVATLIQNPGY
jgi:hypothetical protein